MLYIRSRSGKLPVYLSAYILQCTQNWQFGHHLRDSGASSSISQGVCLSQRRLGSGVRFPAPASVHRLLSRPLMWMLCSVSPNASRQLDLLAAFALCLYYLKLLDRCTMAGSWTPHHILARRRWKVPPPPTTLPAQL